jgi:membrane protein YqaA with SNARE-associated domain
LGVTPDITGLVKSIIMIMTSADPEIAVRTVGRLLLNVLFQNAKRRHSFLALFRHLGAFGLFFFTILDSSPVPTLGGPDILIAILVSTRRNPWYEYAAVAAVGSTIGAYITYRLARRAGGVYLESKFGKARVSAFLDVFKSRGTSTLVASTAIPFPFPTSLVFAAAGASEYRRARYLSVVAASRAARYTVVALLAARYGRHFVRIFRHPTQYWGWLLLFTAIIIIVIVGGILFNRRLVTGDIEPQRAIS